ncbi:thioredoxin [Candidatus Roizmanbacteria bacterium RIFCSPHIGHO2_01_FULL_39_12c]|uniref:Thioredoxin n=1 Tax=Candidatus Roizmanbacteria bacterium RIFCSPHIGHO2_01_FULL_39_12c TaxID=1802031 RepID=A0A1F7GCH4_9BACT|nr:MAG: thioredoxin [Candidatus Roizmanbacteria bacterium RIFCSPHIGHO2_01_FULL_39_12c]OGK46486.1 MAG: thioredoxin [Candidatus Roizmanbacteria bacterium RIFCSPLOWO2_01_FULL_40_13]
MVVTQVAQDTFQKEVLNEKRTVFVDFYADWCGPCRVTSPLIEELSGEIKDMKFVKVDVDKNPQLAQQYSIFSIPTFMIFKGGQVASQFVGAMGKEGFLHEIQKVKTG